MRSLTILARVAFVVTAIAAAVPAAAQEHQHPASPAGPGWHWSREARVFLGANLQVRKFTDFRQAESQNWFMVSGVRDAGRGRLMLHSMLSLEPLTLRRLGSAQAFQTGETYDGAPLIDYQHPHDLFMALEFRYERTAGQHGRLWFSGAPVGAATVGPTAFMHRASARIQPTAPLSHHQLDSTHISRSVLSAGIASGPVSVEVSTFKGREPDENRWDLDLGVPDSWAARVQWDYGRWSAQFSGGRLTAPETVEPFLNVVKLTASIAFEGIARKRTFAFTLAAGRNREFYGDLDGALAEASIALPRALHAYVRAEVTDKNILTAGGLHPPGFTHPHVFSTVGAFTAGLTRELIRRGAGDLAAGADVTAHFVPANLRDSYGTRPYSVHLFLRWSARR